MSAESPPDDAVSGALQQVLAPLARLAVAHGVTHAALDELLKLALVQAADRQHAELLPHRRVSRITTATGINRREVGRLVGLLREAGDGGLRALAVPQRSQASELFYHWRTNPAYCDRRGSPAELPRTGDAPSFETLAQAITRDVHPRSLLDELLRLGLAAFDAERDTVRLVRDAFVPQGDQGRLVRVLGNNVGSHLDAAVDNVLPGRQRHFEQALYADGLSDASMAEFKTLVRDQWQLLTAALVPALEALVAADAAAEAASASPNPAHPPRHHVRLGLYTHARPAAPTTAQAAEPADAARADKRAGARPTTRSRP